MLNPKTLTGSYGMTLMWRCKNLEIIILYYSLATNNSRLSCHQNTVLKFLTHLRDIIHIKILVFYFTRFYCHIWRHARETDVTAKNIGGKNQK